MKKYYKDGKIVQRPTSLIYKGCTYTPPSDAILKLAGYEVKEEEEVALKNDIESIKKCRQFAYKNRSDLYLTAYLAYTELGELEKASEMKELWIQERVKIDKEFPYPEK